MQELALLVEANPGGCRPHAHAGAAGHLLIQPLMGVGVKPLTAAMDVQAGEVLQYHANIMEQVLAQLPGVQLTFKDTDIQDYEVLRTLLDAPSMDIMMPHFLEHHIQMSRLVGTYSVVLADMGVPVVGLGLSPGKVIRRKRAAHEAIAMGIMMAAIDGKVENFHFTQDLTWFWNCCRFNERPEALMALPAPATPELADGIGEPENRMLLALADGLIPRGQDSADSADQIQFTPEHGTDGGRQIPFTPPDNGMGYFELPEAEDPEEDQSESEDPEESPSRKARSPQVPPLHMRGPAAQSASSIRSRSPIRREGAAPQRPAQRPKAKAAKAAAAQRPKATEQVRRGPERGKRGPKAQVLAVKTKVKAKPSRQQDESDGSRQLAKPSTKVKAKRPWRQ